MNEYELLAFLFVCVRFLWKVECVRMRMRRQPHGEFF